MRCGRAIGTPRVFAAKSPGFLHFDLARLHRRDEFLQVRALRQRCEVGIARHLPVIAPADLNRALERRERTVGIARERLAAGEVVVDARVVARLAKQRRDRGNGLGKLLRVVKRHAARVLRAFHRRQRLAVGHRQRAPRVAVDVEVEVRRVLLHEQLVEVGHAVRARRGGDHLRKLLAVHVALHPDHARQVDRVRDAVDLRAQAAVVDRLEHGPEDLRAELVGPHPVKARKPGERDEIARGNVPQPCVFVGDGERRPTVGVHDHDDGLGRLPGERELGCRENERDRRRRRVSHRHHAASVRAGRCVAAPACARARTCARTYTRVSRSRPSGRTASRQAQAPSAVAIGGLRAPIARSRSPATTARFPRCSAQHRAVQTRRGNPAPAPAQPEPR